MHVRTTLHSRTVHRLSLSVCVALATLAGAAPSRADTLAIWDDFNAAAVETWSSGTTHGNYHVDFTGFGSVRIVRSRANRMIELSPGVSATASETHAALVTTAASWGDFDTQVTMTTAEQLRTNDPPNTWEVAWFVWHFTDNDHFYYFALKPNGWELGKRDPEYPGGQRFLATGNSHTVVVGRPTIVRVRQKGNAIGIYLDHGEQLTYFQDDERPYLSGKVGFYTEDARVRFDDLDVYSIP